MGEQNTFQQKPEAQDPTVIGGIRGKMRHIWRVTGEEFQRVRIMG